MRFDAVHQRRAVGGLGGADPIASAFEDGDDLHLDQGFVFKDKDAHQRTSLASPSKSSCKLLWKAS